MTDRRYPLLYATLGKAAARIPNELAHTLETRLATAQAANAGEGPTLLDNLHRIRRGEGADGQPWPNPRLAPGDCIALSRIDRATAGLTLLLEMLHASERVRVDGEEAQQVSDDVREGLLLACRGLCEYVGTQLPAA